MSWRGSHIGRFRVDGELGRGAMGLVLRAYDPQLARPVAIKILTERAPGVADGTTINLRETVDHDGLLDEARALAQIADSNVLAVYEIGTDADKSFLVMELVDGENVRQWLAERPRTTTEILGVFAQAGRGLAAAHRRGVIHRDFKPENVLISPDGRVRVCDFGIAAFAHARELIRAGRAGTPRYMAPELWGDQSASVASDVYAFAVSLIEAICGEVPTEPALADVALAKRGVDPRVRTMLVRALDAEPARRPASIDEIVRSFSGRPRRGRRLPIAVAIAGVATAAVIVATSRPARSNTCEDARSLLAARWSAADRVAVRDAVSAVGGAPDDARSIVERLDQYAGVWRQLYERTCALGDVPQRTARLSCLERRLFELGSTVRALRQTPSLELALGRSNALVDLGACIEATVVYLPANRAVRGDIEALTARVIELYDRGLAKLGGEGDQVALERSREEALALGDVELAIRIDRIRAQLAFNGRKAADAFRILDEAHALASQHHHDASAAVILVEGASYANRIGQLDVAKSKLDIARPLLERSAGATPYSRLVLYRTIGENARGRGAFAEAHAALDKADAAVATMDPRDPLWTAQLGLSRSSLLEQEGKLVQALEVARSTVTTLRTLGRQGVPDLGDVLGAIARMELQRGDRTAAIAAMRDRLALLERFMPEDDAGRIAAEAQIALGLINAGEAETARDVLVRLIERARRVQGLAADVSDLRNFLARAERMLGRYAEARLQLEHALAELRARTGERDPAVGMNEITFAIVELEAGELDRAATHLRIAEDVLAALPADNINRLDLAEVQIAHALAADRPDAAAAIATRTLAVLAERNIEDARIDRFLVASAAVHNARREHAAARDVAERAVERRRASGAAPLDLALAEVELWKARYALGEVNAAAELARVAKLLDNPATRFDHAQLGRWLRTHGRTP